MAEKSMYAWQQECLSTPRVLEGTCNLVFTAPTSSGKTYVAETVIMEHVKRNPTKIALVVLPFVALCREQRALLSEKIATVNDWLKVRTAYGGQRSPALLSQSTGIIVATIESAYSLVLRMVSLGTCLESVFSCVFADEFHMIGDEKRGHALEMMITLFRDKAPCVQLLAASATLGNPEAIARWLGAAAYVSSERPVPLTHHIVLAKGTVVDLQGGEFVQSRKLPPNQRDALVQLVREAIDESVLVFCASKKECEGVAKMLGDVVGETLVAFHHADVGAIEKDRVEKAYMQGNIKILVCTPTLAAGVNLPAKRVVILHAYLGVSTNLLSPTKYHQMAGRAGRAGLQTSGHCYLFQCPKVKEDFVKALVRAPPDAVESRVDIKRAVVELLAADCSPYILQKTLGAFDAPAIDAALQEVSTAGMAVRLSSDSWISTPLGRCLGACGTALEHGMVLRQELESMQRTLHLYSNLQACFVCTVVEHVYPQNNADVGMQKRLASTEPELLQALPIDVGYCTSRSYGYAMYRQANEQSYQRLLLAFALQASLQGLDVDLDLPAGAVEAALATAIQRADAAMFMCKHLGWHLLAAFFGMFKEQLLVGGESHVVALMKVPGICCGDAKKLSHAGIWEPEDVARSSAIVVARALGLREDSPKVAQMQAGALAFISAADAHDADADALPALMDAVALAKRPGAKRGSGDLELVWPKGKRCVTPEQAARFLKTHKGAVVSPNVKDIRPLLEPLGASLHGIRDTNLAAAQIGQRTHTTSRDSLDAHSWLPAPTRGEFLDADIQKLLAAMEQRGFLLDVEETVRRSDGIKQDISRYEHEIQRLAGNEFDIGSPHQIATVLFDTLKLPRIDGRSTNDQVLAALRDKHPIVELIRKHRAGREVLEGCSMLMQHADDAHVVKPVFCMTSSATGRITTERPNLQCIPKQLRSLLAPPGSAGKKILCADFRHAELRLLAHFSGDPNLIAVLSDVSNDPFTSMAASLNVERGVCKTVVYSILYGGGSASIARKLNDETSDRAHAVHKAFYEAYPVLRQWIKDFEDRIEQQRYVDVMGGRRRVFASDATRRQYLNTLCQASCSYLLKKAMIAVEAEVPGALLLCLHDELVLQVPGDADFEAIATKVADSMASVEQLKVPLPVSTRICDTWC